MNDLFRQRVGIPKEKTITFASLGMVLKKMATTIPFENLAVMENRTRRITKENLVHKILINNEGGLCYDLNLILHFFLIENDFNVALTEAIIYDHAAREYHTVGTHLINLLTHKGQVYLIDGGYGGNVPLKPVPFTGAIITSDNGEFRVRRAGAKDGQFVFEMKLKHRDTGWRTGYAIDSKVLIGDISKLNHTQKFIVEHGESPFNKGPFVTRLAEGGYLTLTETSFTRSVHGVTSKETVDKLRFKELLKLHFGL